MSQTATGSPDQTPDEPRTEYTLWATFARPVGGVELRPDDVAALEEAIAAADGAGVTTRGIYDVSALKADADVMLWLHGADLAAVQGALRTLRRTTALARLTPTWNAAGVHRDAEFNRAHVPAFMRGVEAKGWLCVYPFVRSYEWYLLPDDERRTMLADHGRKGAAHRGVLANTVAAFALGDYEWVLPLEADDPIELVDLMRDLRYTEARRHVREEVPFYTGRRIAPAELVEVLA